MSRREKAQELITGYRGPLSSYAEWHAFGTGFYYGARTNFSRVPKDLWNEDSTRYNPDVVKEPQYAYAGFELGDTYRRHRRKVQAGVGILLTAAVSYLSGVF